MNDEGSKQEQAVDEQRPPKDREKRERQRLDDDEDDTSQEVANGSGDNKMPVQPEPGESDTEATDKSGTERSEKQLHVPQITVDQSSRLDAARQVEDVPADTDRAVDVPQVQPSAIELLDADELAETVPVEADEGIVAVPQVTTKTKHGVDLEELDDDQPDGLERVQQVQIPQVTVASRTRIQPFDTFLDTAPDLASQESNTTTQIADESEEDQETTEVIKPEKDAAGAFSALEARNDWITSEWPDPLELLFGSSGTDTKSDTPVVVLVKNDDLVGVAETVVKRLYREKEGGEPDLRKFDTANQLSDEERWMSGDSRIFTAELPDDEWETLANEDDYRDEWRSIWRNRFDQLFSGQQFGAIIFNCSQIPQPEVTSLPHHPPILVELEARVPWRKVANVFWDLDLEDAEKTRTFSQLFDRDANGMAQDRWTQIMGAADGQFDYGTTDDEAESDKHYALKVFVVKWVAEQLWEADEEFTEYNDLAEIEDYREIEKTILTEQPVQVTDDTLVTPDVRYGSRVFEVEMFFEEADATGVVSKLQQTVRKYEDVEQKIDEIDIVVDNLTLLLHLKELAQFKRVHQPWEADHADITLCTVDLGQEKLVPVNEIVNRITEISLE